MRVTRLAAVTSRTVFAAGLIVLITLALSALRQVLDTPIVALLLLIPVGLSTAIWGLGSGITAALFAFLGFNYFFISPYYTLTVHRPEDVVVLVVFLAVAVVMSQLVGRAQAGMDAANAREQEATQLYELSTSLAGRQDDGDILRILAEQVRTGFSAQLVEIQLMGDTLTRVHASSGTAIPDASASPSQLAVPIQAVQGEIGAMRIWRADPFSTTERRLLHAFLSQGALALERAALARAESRTNLLEESDRFKSSLLSSVSHELRSPLATIKAAASSLRGGQINWDSPARAELLAAIDEEADHLNMLVGNLLDMSRIESGALRPARQWNVLPEIIESVAGRMRRPLESHHLEVEVPDDFPLVPVDFAQIEQVFTNLISNSIKYAPAGTVIRIRARAEDRTKAHVEVSNQGPPVPPEHLDRIFDKFYRITAADRVTGTGLGLSICKGIIEAHGGQIWAKNLPNGFAFLFTLPLSLDGALPPELPIDPETT
jgi:two-component system, OmpR family, sensor histidine kinase KdpD